MEHLRALFEAMGFASVETFIASGNVLFQTPSKSKSDIESTIETVLAQRLGFEVAAFVRTVEEVAAIANYRPFSETAMESAAALSVAFLSKPLDGAQEATLLTLRSEIDDFQVHLSEVYWLCTKKQSESKFSNAVFERTLRVPATFRSINTIRKLAARYEKA